MKRRVLGLILWLVIFLVLGELYPTGHSDWGIAILVIWTAINVARKLFT
jgi:hypothetical protein